MIQVVVFLAAVAIILAPAILLGGWVVMLCLGALAHIFGAATYAIGFWPSTLVSIILTVLFG